ncbi:MAG: hypothetical protein CM15mP84_06600 [Cellvibrionales bacterium]|nr:MAG: hypothetical protein CM15mP84_06600 [Cellvibrionales bacterium]
MMKRAVQLRAEWLSLLKEEFESEHMDRLRHFLLSEKEQGKRFTRQVANGLLRWMRPPMRSKS